MSARAGSPAPDSPADISGRNWRDVVLRSLRAMTSDSMALAGAGIAFYMVWAFFPAVVVLVMVGALALGKPLVLATLAWIRLDLPDSFNAIVVAQLDAIAEHSRGFSLATVLGALALASWSGMRGARALMTTLNLVYDEKEERSFWVRQAIALGLCLLGGLFVLAALVLIVGLTVTGVASSAHGEPALLAPSRWPVLIALMMLLLSIAYRYGPSRRPAKWRWVTWGATVSATLWVAASVLLSYYTAQYHHLDALLGSLGSIVAFLLWSYLTVMAVLLGAHVNAELERHTAADSGSGTARPVGKRGASVADTVRDVR